MPAPCRKKINIMTVITFLRFTGPLRNRVQLLIGGFEVAVGDSGKTMSLGQRDFL